MTDAEKRLLKKKDEFFLLIRGGNNAKGGVKNENLRTKCTNSPK